MRKEIELFQFIKIHLKQDKKVVLMVVVQSSGSSPGRQGFKMAVADDGTLFGSIGGGVMEVSLVQSAKCKVQNAEPKSAIVEQVHRKDVPNSSGMICSGKQTIIVRELTKDDLITIQEIIEAFETKRGARLQITNDEIRVTSCELPSANYVFHVTNDGFLYKEKLGFKQNLYIIGGGHCALALSEIMSRLDFCITVFDDRNDLNTLKKNQFAHRVEVIESYENIGTFVPSDENGYVVVMTLGYKFDEIVIRQLFDTNFKYFGVLGSKAKMKALLKTLEKEGFDKAKLAKINTPIGLPINSHTPEEIAVSIAAEIISVKNSKK